MRAMGHRRDFDDIGVQSGQPMVQVVQVLRRFLKIVVADDPLGLSEPRDAGRDIFLQIDIFDAAIRRDPAPSWPRSARI